MKSNSPTMSVPNPASLATSRLLGDIELRDMSNTPSQHGNEHVSNEPGVDWGSELDQISSSYYRLIQSYPSQRDQRSLEYKLLWESLSSQSKEDEILCRILVADARDSGPPACTECQNAEQLADLVDNRISTGRKGIRLYVLEDLSVRSLCVLGSRLKIHLSVFARYFMHFKFSSIHADNMAKFLASDFPAPSPAEEKRSESRYYMLRYFDILSKDPDSYAKASPFQPWLKRLKEISDSPFAAFNILRRVFMPAKTDDWDTDGEVITVQSKLCVWKDPSLCQTVLLIDPTLRDPKFVKQINGSPSPEPVLQIHFAECAELLDAAIDLDQAPPKSTALSLFDDIKAMLTSPQESHKVTECVLVFLRHYVIRKWIIYLNHVHRCLVSVRDRQSTMSAQPDGGWSEEMFVSLKYWTEVLPMVQLTVETNMIALGINTSEDSSFGVGGMSEAKLWWYIHRMLGSYAKMFERVADSFAQGVAIREAQSSSIQAKASATQAQFVGRLTGLGTLFLPASLVAGILSMGGDFLPGERLFWVYFLVLIPILLFVVLVLTTDLGTYFIPEVPIPQKKTRDRTLETHESTEKPLES